MLRRLPGVCGVLIFSLALSLLSSVLSQDRGQHFKNNTSSYAVQQAGFGAAALNSTFLTSEGCAPAEVCDGIDNDGDGAVDEGYDEDGDGYSSCNGDCDDYDATMHPNAPEVECDGVDQDCNGTDLKTYYQDKDRDGYGNGEVPLDACTKPTGYVSNNLDCDDIDSLVKPGAYEHCDGEDGNCDGLIDNVLIYPDADGDRDGAEGSTGIPGSCNPTVGYGLTNWDCDDSNPEVHTYAVEVCNGIDDNCDNNVDQDEEGNPPADAPTWYTDDDLDGYGCRPEDNTEEDGEVCHYTEWCTDPTDDLSSYSAQTGDCNDADPSTTDCD